MDYVIEVQDVKKKYGFKPALNQINCNIQAGRIVGLMGPNGSGKTTLMKIMAGLLHEDSGNIKVMGEKVGYATKKTVSFMPDHNILYKWMKVKDSIQFYKDFFPDYDIEKCAELLDFMKLEQNDKIQSLSKGMLERLLLVLTMSRNASLYVLDEPLGGVDPVAKAKIIDSILNNYNTSKSSILISTHLIKDVERLFDDVIFIRKGSIVLMGDCETLREEKGKTIEDLYMEVFQND